MRDAVPFPTRRLRLSALAVVISGLAGCAPPLMVGTPHDRTNVASAALADSTADSTRIAPPTVEVRYYAGSPTISVVAWSPDETGFGLRALIRRDGSLVEHHRMFVSTYHSVEGPYCSRAQSPYEPLELTGVTRDIQSCFGYPDCSPYETFGVRIPDPLIRARRDSLPVTFFGRAGYELKVTVHRELIAAYLATVDSVSAALRKKAQ